MAVLGVISSIVSGVVRPVTTYLTNRQKISAQLQENKLKVLQAAGDRQADLIKQGLAADATWENASIQAGLKYRGVELLILSVPMVMCFTPWAYVVKRGFEALSETPPWFRWLLIMIYTANYGIRVWRRNFVSDT